MIQLTLWVRFLTPVFKNRVLCELDELFLTRCKDIIYTDFKLILCKDIIYTDF